MYKGKVQMNKFICEYDGKRSRNHNRPILGFVCNTFNFPLSVKNCILRDKTLKIIAIMMRWCVASHHLRSGIQDPRNTALAFNSTQLTAEPRYDGHVTRVVLVLVSMVSGVTMSV